jgi:hypothetical protein
MIKNQFWNYFFPLPFHWLPWIWWVILEENLAFLQLVLLIWLLLVHPVPHLFG